jgi:glycosyltransferase involved in cell wall biosynthesis
MRVESGHKTRIFEYRRFGSTPLPKKALLSFLTEPVIADAQGQPTFMFSNDGIARTWPKVLNQLGYEVDIVNWDDADFRPQKKYDLLVQHGGKNFKILKGGVKPAGKIIYFSTGSYWKFHNLAETKRFEEFEKRHDQKLLPDRFIEGEEETANADADGIICLGNSGTKLTYAKFPLVINLNNASFPDHHFGANRKNYENGRKEFVFFSGPGNIHKGLDLVLDAMVDTDLELHICTMLDQGFRDYYADTLYNKANIHTYGFVAPRSKKYYEIMKKCDFAILPSCSEGSPGSVIECMQNGLIPIVSQSAHIDTEDFGFTLSDVKIESIQKILIKCSQLSLDDITARSQKAKRAAETEYSPDKFEQNLTAAVRHIVGKT